MNSTRALTAFLGCSFTALAACSSSGSSGFTSFNDLPETSSVEIDGQEVTAQFVAIESPETRFDVTEISGTQPSKLTVTTEDGEIVELGLVVIDGQAVFIPLEDPSGLPTRDDLIQAFRVTEDGELNGSLALITAADREFEYQRIGVWAVGVFDEAGAFGAGSYGAKTRASRLPSGQSARYDGRAISVVVLESGELLSLESALSLDTNFSTVTLGSSDTREIGIDPGSPGDPRSQFDFSGTGSVSGSGFTADVSGDLLAGRADGQFYGPNAEEVGGTFSLTGADGTVQIGAFGAD